MLLKVKAAACAAMLLLACVWASAPARAQEKSAIKEGFTLPAGSAKILLFRPSIKVGAQSTGGLFEPNADWTDEAKTNIGAALSAMQSKLGNQIIVPEEPVGEAAQVLAEYRALFSTVAGAVITYKFFAGNRLPTKKREGVFDWTLGPGVKDIPGAAEADYILFIYTEDQFGSTGRKAVQLLAALARVHVESGVHKGFAGLVDIRTGDLVWLNADLRMGGDVRTTEGAQKRVTQLLEDFPGRPLATGTGAK
ncbi:MAG TPA: hypothetical protein VJ859_07640 [Allosphingosinicella sp.]|nr:hypothetical protein [Allosphingosinicella sp.]